MYIDPRPIRPPGNDAQGPRNRLPPTLAFALCAVLAMAGAVLLRGCGVAVPDCGADPAAAYGGP